MAYLRQRDYLLFIQQTELNQLTTNNPTLLLDAERFAEAQMISHLVQRYDTKREFQPTTAWSNVVTYSAWDLVEINYPSYDVTQTYSVGARVINSGIGYICITAVTVAEPFNPAKWTVLGNQYDLYYAIQPEPEFDYQTFYTVGSKVFWQNKVYTALKETVIPTHAQSLQYPSMGSIPYANVFPSDPVNGPTYWHPDTLNYTVPAGTLPTDTDYFAFGDNRSQQCLEYTVNIAIYKATQRISPQNVPANRVRKYEEAMNWLQDVSHGNVNCDIPEKQPTQGVSIMSGGQVKRINQW